MNHGSLFSGIGGFDLAASWMGWTNIFHCEWNPFCQKVLKHYWPESISYDDICKTDFTIHRGQIDILTGGFPCQPYSVAGKRKGTEDSRHLWPEMLRAIRECKPTWIVGENVPGIISWSEGLVFEQVCTELENEGYEVQPVILPACGVNAPHRRDRCWFVANSIGDRHGNGPRESGQTKEEKQWEERTEIQWQRNGCDIERINAEESITNTTNIRLQRWEQSTERHKMDDKFGRHDVNTKSWFEGFPTQSPILGGNDGILRELDGITFSKWRKESIKAYGNAIVPQVAYKIFKVIEQINICTTSKSKTDDH